MAWLWPNTDDPRSAKLATSGAVDLSFFFSVLAAIIGSARLIHGDRLYGIAMLIVAIPFAVSGRRIHQMSRAGAVLGISVLAVTIA